MKRISGPKVYWTLLLTALLGGLILTACGDATVMPAIGAVPANTPLATVTPASEIGSTGPAKVFGSAECQKIAAAEKPWPKLTVPSAADYADVLYVEGIEYQGDYSSNPGNFEKGPELTRIKYEMSGYDVSLNWRCLDSVSAFIDLDTLVYTVKGYSPKFRLAAQSATGWHLYNVFNNPTAKIGAELWDIAGKVESIGISGEGGTEITLIKDPAQVAKLMDLVLKSPTNQTPDYRSAGRFGVNFHLQDGTLLQLGLSEAGDLRGGIGVTVPKEFGDTLEATVKAVPRATIVALTPTPKVPVGQPVNLAQQYHLDQAQSVQLKFAEPNSREITTLGQVKQLATTLDKDLPALDSTLYSLVPDGNVGAIIFKFGETNWVSFMYDPKAGILQYWDNEVYNRVTIAAPKDFISLIGIK